MLVFSLCCSGPDPTIGRVFCKNLLCRCIYTDEPYYHHAFELAFHYVISSSNLPADRMSVCREQGGCRPSMYSVQCTTCRTQLAVVGPIDRSHVVLRMCPSEMMTAGLAGLQCARPCYIRSEVDTPGRRRNPHRMHSAGPAQTAAVGQAARLYAPRPGGPPAARVHPRSACTILRVYCKCIHSESAAAWYARGRCSMAVRARLAS